MSVTHTPVEATDPVEQLLERARRTEVSRAGVEALSDGLDAEPALVDPALERAIRQFEGAAGALLAMAAYQAGVAAKPDLVWPLLSLVPDIHWVPLLVGAAGSAQLPVLLKALDSGHLSTEREALCVLIAVERLQGLGVPPAIRSRLRSLAQSQLSGSAGLAVGLAARAMDDPDVRAEAARWIAFAALEPGQGMLDGVRALLSGDFPEVIPTRRGGVRVGEPPPHVEAGRVGRNDPCPCGSGLKFKRCCANKAAPAAPGAPRLPTAAELDRASSSRPREMSAYELGRLDPRSLDTRALIDAIRGLSSHRYWQPAEAAMEVLSGRRDLPMGERPDGYREELIQEAIRAGAVDVVRRQVALLRDPDEMERLKLPLALLESSGGALAELEATALRLLQGQSEEGWTLAYQLLDHSPALGVVVSRAILDPARPADSETLLAEVEQARIRLGLPTGDPALRLYERMLQPAAEGSLHAARARELGQELRGKAAEVSGLQQKLERQQAQLDRLEEERARAPKSTQSGERDRADLRQKIAQMKTLIAEGQAERAQLRRQLAEAARQDAAEGLGAKPAEAEAADPSEVEGGLPAWERVLVPVIAPKAAAALTEASASLSARAIRLTAELATGESAAWTGVKRLKGRADIWSARVGIHHRLLFRLEQELGRLEVVAFIQRRDLDATLRQM